MGTRVDHRMINMRGTQQYSRPVTRLRVTVNYVTNRMGRGGTPYGTCRQQRLFRPLFRRSYSSRDQARGHRRARPSYVHERRSRHSHHSGHTTPRRRYTPFSQITTRQRTRTKRRSRRPTSKLLPRFSLPTTVPQYARAGRVSRVPRTVMGRRTSRIRPTRLIRRHTTDKD